VTDGRRWLALDADLFGKRFTDDLYHQFGWAGVATWVAFLCACKRSRNPGRISALSDTEAAHILGLAEWDLADNDGKPWTLDDFWAFTGRKKQTKRTHRGRHFDVISTHWERWQDTAGRAREAEQKRTSRAQKRRDGLGHEPDTPRTNVGSYSDLDSDNPPTPRRAGGSGKRFASNGNGNGQTPTGPAIPDWQPEPEPHDVVDPGAVANLRANLSGRS
jgi:hypothetical protein